MKDKLHFGPLELIRSALPYRKATLSRATTIICLTVACLIAMTLATTRALQVPILQESDELAHIDYAMAIYDAGGLFKTLSSKRATHATVQATYLMKHLQYARLRYNFDAQAPIGYGTRSFGDRVNMNAPRRSNTPPRPGDRIPYVAFSYPAPYYLALAEMSLVADNIRGPKLLDDVYLMRFAGVPFLAITMISVFWMFRLSGATTYLALLAATASGIFPAVNTIFSYVQPDLLTTTFVSAAVALACARVRHHEIGTLRWVFGLAIGLATISKVHYGILAWFSLETSIWFAFRAKLSDKIKRLTISAISPCLALAIVSKTTLTSNTPVFATVDGPHTGWSLFPKITSSISSAFLGGDTFGTYWYQGGIYLSKNYIPDWMVAPITYAVFVFAGYALSKYFVAFSMNFQKNTSLMCLVSSASIPLIVIYATWTAFIIGVDVYLDNQLGMLGRYWAPVIGPTVALSTLVPLRCDSYLKVNQSRTLLGAAWFLAAVVLAGFDLHQNYMRFYESRPISQHVNHFIAIDDIRIGKIKQKLSYAIKSPPRSTISIHGWGLDDSTGRPSREAFFEIDGHTQRISYPLPTLPYVAMRLADDDLPAITFEGSIATTHLAYGHHKVRLFLTPNEGRSRSYWAGTFDLWIVGT